VHFPEAHVGEKLGALRSMCLGGAGRDRLNTARVFRRYLLDNQPVVVIQELRRYARPVVKGGTRRAVTRVAPPFRTGRVAGPIGAQC